VDSLSIRLIDGSLGQFSDLQNVLEAAPRYAHRVTRLPPGNADAQSICSALPEGKAGEDKFVFGIYLQEQMVGCAELSIHPRDGGTLDHGVSRRDPNRYWRPLRGSGTCVASSLRLLA
jgi:hypothetical protein